MKAETLRFDKGRYDSLRLSSYGIISYGRDNDYPQSVLDIVSASQTGAACLEIYKRFVYGNGFMDETLSRRRVNDDGETLDDILERAAGDYATFGGFALHLNFDFNGNACGLSHVPFEFVRLCEDDGDHAGQVAIHPDWGRRSKIKTFDPSMIDYVDMFDPVRNPVLERMSGCPDGAARYNGQVYYHTGKVWRYPLPIYDAELTDMASQEAIANVTYRNSRQGFMPAGMFINYQRADDEDAKRDAEALKGSLMQLTGDMNAGKILYLELDCSDKENRPEFLTIPSANYDKQFEASRAKVEQSIGQAFMQPPILRAENVGAGFGAEIMQQAYMFYNSITQKERYNLERAFAAVMRSWHEDIGAEYKIQPLQYADSSPVEKFGEQGLRDIMEIATNKDMPLEQRKAALSALYELDDDLVNKITR